MHVFHALFVGAHDARDQGIAHHIVIGKVDEGGAFHILQRLDRFSEAGSRADRQIDLRQIAGDHHAGIFTEAGEEHFHLHRRRVLRLVENDDGVGKRAPAHERERRNLDLARFEAFQHRVGRQHIVERVVKRTQVRVDFFLDVAGQETEALAGFDCRAGQYDAVDLARQIHRNRDGDGDIGLSGSRRAEAEDQLVRAHRLYIGGLAQ